MQYSINISQAELMVIYQGLGEVPLKLSQNVYANIYQQVSKQDEAKAIPIDDVVIGGATEVGDE